MPIPNYAAAFTAEIIRYPGKGGWTFAVVPEEHAPTVTLHWGRTPVRAVVNGVAWETSVWREKSGRTLLALPKKVRTGLDDVDMVTVRLEYSLEYR